MPKNANGNIDIATMRQKLGINQSHFWGKFGVTQSAGSRYENERKLPKPLHILISLWMKGVITDAHLEAAQKKIKRREKSA